MDERMNMKDLAPSRVYSKYEMQVDVYDESGSNASYRMAKETTVVQSDRFNVNVNDGPVDSVTVRNVVHNLADALVGMRTEGKENQE